jgi:hypothetical protein
MLLRSRRSCMVDSMLVACEVAGMSSYMPLSLGRTKDSGDKISGDGLISKAVEVGYCRWIVTVNEARCTSSGVGNCHPPWPSVQESALEDIGRASLSFNITLMVNI